MQKLVLAALTLLILTTSVQAQTPKRKRAKPHELAPFAGLYAPDRFETSLAYGVRYFYRLNKRNSAGAVIGFAKAGQDFFRKSINLAPVAGSDRVIFHAARFMRTMIVRSRIQPYLATQLGLTRLHDEYNMTLGFGLGTRVITKKKTTWRYEIMSHFFRSGVDTSSWTNKSIEIAFALGFYL